MRPASPFVTLVQAGSFQRAGELASQARPLPELPPERRGGVGARLGLRHRPDAVPRGLSAWLHRADHEPDLPGRAADRASPSCVKEMARGRTPSKACCPRRARPSSATWCSCARADGRRRLLAVARRGHSILRHALCGASAGRGQGPQAARAAGPCCRRPTPTCRAGSAGGDTSLDGWRQRTPGGLPADAPGHHRAGRARQPARSLEDASRPRAGATTSARSTSPRATSS